MAYDPRTGRFEQENTSVSRRVTGLMAQESPLMQQARTQGRQSANRRGLLNSSMGVQAAQTAAYGAALPIASQEAQQAHQSNLQGREIQIGDIAQQRDIGSRERMQEADITSRERVAGLDRDAQMRIAEMNVAAHEREKAASLAAAFENSYTQMIASIMNNPEIPASSRQQYIQHAAQVRDSNLRLVEQMYGIELDWSTPGGQGSSASGGSPMTMQQWLAQIQGAFR